MDIEEAIKFNKFLIREKKSIWYEETLEVSIVIYGGEPKVDRNHEGDRKMDKDNKNDLHNKYEDNASSSPIYRNYTPLNELLKECDNTEFCEEDVEFPNKVWEHSSLNKSRFYISKKVTNTTQKIAFS